MLLVNHAFFWLDKIAEVRDRLLASPRFRRWAIASPLTRFVARRRARAVFDLCAGFVYSQVLHACVRLRLFDVLAAGPQTPEAIAQKLSLPEASALRLLGAASSLRLADKRAGGRFGIGPLGAAMLGNPAISAMVEHHAVLYDDLRDPVALLRGHEDTGLARYWAYSGTPAAAQLPPELVANYTALMSASQPLVAEEIIATYAFGRHRCLLDAGGGDGTFLAAVAAAAPSLELMLFDLPPVAERARERFAKAGLNARARVFGGDFLSESLPSGADVVSLVRVIHDHDDDAAITILRAAHRALPERGCLVLAEPMSGTAGAEPMGEAYFGFYLLAMGRGRPRTAGELADLLSRAGFSEVQVVATRMPLQTGLIVGRRLTQSKAGSHGIRM